MSDLGRIEITEELCNMIMIGRLIHVLEVILASVANDIKKTTVERFRHKSCPQTLGNICVFRSNKSNVVWNTCSTIIYSDSHIFWYSVKGCEIFKFTCIYFLTWLLYHQQLKLPNLLNTLIKNNDCRSNHDLILKCLGIWIVTLNTRHSQ